MNELFTILIFLFVFLFFIFKCYCTYCLIYTIDCSVAFSWRLDSWPQTFGGKQRWVLQKICLWTPMTWLDLHLWHSFRFYFLNEILDIWYVVVTFCNLPRQNVGGGGCLTQKDQTTDNYIYRGYIPSPTTCPQIASSLSDFKCLLSWGVVSDLG